MQRMNQKVILGDRWVRCDECGFGYRYSQIKAGVSLSQRGYHVCPTCFDDRHPHTDWKNKPRKEGKLIGGNIGSPGGDGTAYALPDSNDLLVHYKFDDDVTDETGNYDGTVAGTTTYETGKINNCISSAVGDGYVTIPARAIDLFSGAFTVTLWVKPDDGIPASSNVLMGVQNGAIDVFAPYIDTAGKIVVVYQSNGGRTTATTDAAVFSNGAASSFTHIAISVSQHAGIVIYIGGSKVDATSSNTKEKIGELCGAMSDWTTTMNPIMLSHNNDGTPQSFLSGDVDDLRIYRGTITDNQAMGFI